MINHIISFHSVHPTLMFLYSVSSDENAESADNCL